MSVSVFLQVVCVLCVFMVSSEARRGITGAGEMAQWLKALVTLPEAPSSVSSSHVGVGLQMPVSGNPTPSFSLHGHSKHTHTHTHKLKTKAKKNKVYSLSAFNPSTCKAEIGRSL